MEPTTARPPLTRMGPARWQALDVAVAILYAVPALLVLVNEASDVAGSVAAMVGLMTFTLPLALRRRRPKTALTLLLVGLVVIGGLEPTAAVVGLVALVYVLYMWAAVEPPGVAVLGLLAALAVAAVTALPDFRHIGAAVVFSVAYLVAWGLGYAVGAHRRYTLSVLALQAELAAGELQKSRDEVAQERLRIARELHDIVAHGMSVITVQAGYAALVIDDEPAAARGALTAIESTGRQTLAELRHLLTVLRQDPPRTGTDAREFLPAPGLGDLPALLRERDRAGLHVALVVTGRSRPLPPGLDLAAFRIVQEALTNVVRHAQTSHATVRVAYGDSLLTLEVSDDGRGAKSAPQDGHGLVGIRERAQLYGGTVELRTKASGFAVTCRVPLPDVGVLGSAMPRGAGAS